MKEWLSNVENELKSNILDYWADYTVDREHGGFYGKLADDRQVVKGSPKSLVLNTRLLWTFAKAYRAYKEPRYLELAERAYDYLLAHFKDGEYGGYYWMVDALGEPIDTKKQTYGEAFAIYAFSEYFLASGSEESLEEAKTLFSLLRQHTYDPVYKGYFEAYTREWVIAEDSRLSPSDMNDKKSMNTSLHVLEAFTNLYRAWPSEDMRAALKEMIEVMIDKVVDAETFHFQLFFDEAWSSKIDVASYGHDIEGSWLIYEAAHVLGDRDVLEKAKDVSIRMAEAIYEKGVAPDGGIWDEADKNGLVTTDKSWWPQAEGVVGFINAYQLTSERKYLDAAIRCWEYIDRAFIDKTYGEWFTRVSESGEPYRHLPKVDPWKCPYHNGRACFEILERLR